MTDRSAVRLLALAALAVTALAQAPTPKDEDDVDAPSAFLTVRPNLRGDVEFRVVSDIGRDKLAALMRSSLGCDWRAKSDGGTCRKLLPTDGTRVEGKLTLAPLVQGLHQAGAEYVTVSLYAAGEAAAAAGQAWKKRDTKTSSSRRSNPYRTEVYGFYSAADDDLPPAFTVRMGEAWQPMRLAGPLVFVLTGPALLAWWMGRRGKRKGTSSYGILWLNWILLGSWLYWISAMSLTDIIGFSMQVPVESAIPGLLIGVIVYAAPPLAAMAACVLILAPGPKEDPEADRGRTVKQLLAQEGAFIVPLGVFLVGASLFEHDSSVAMISMPAAYVLYRVLRWLAARLNRREIRVLESGELYKSVLAIAEAGGAKVKGVFLIGSRRTQDVNAYATSTGAIMVTRGLVERLTRREVNAVVAHEAGHLSGKHISYKMILFWAYIVVIGPGASVLMNRAPVPGWVLTLPILPMLYVLAGAQLSQKHEFSADARAVAITQDPEGMIAALARLSKITRSPVDWGGMQGSILTHPSMKKRVLAIARRSGVAAERALAVLEDPDVIAVRPRAEHAGAGLPRHYALPAGLDGAEPIFNPSALASHVFWCSWGMRVVLVVLLAGMGLLSEKYLGYSLRTVRFFFACTPLAAWLYLRFSNAWDRLFRKRLRRRIARRLQPAPGAIFVSLVPGERVYPFGGSYDWDMGFLWLTPEGLTYQGERAWFTVRRSEITGIGVQTGPLAWDRVHGVAVRHTGGAFILRRCDKGGSLRQARRLEARLLQWQRGEIAVNTSPASHPVFPAPQLPVLRLVFPSRGKAALKIAWRAVTLFAGTLLTLAVAVPITGVTAIFALVPFAAALTYLVATCPLLLRRRPRVTAEPAPAPVA